MPSPFELAWTSPVTLTTTTLNGMGDGNLWHSGEITDPSPTYETIKVSYSLVFSSAPVSAASWNLWVIAGDESSSSEIWDGGISTTAGVISSAQAKAEALAALGTPHKTHAWQTSHGATFKGHLTVDDYSTSWQVVIQPVGGSVASSGSIVRYRYYSVQG